MIAICGVILYYENDPYIDDHGTVVEVGCRNHIYKTRTMYDCSADVKWESTEKIEREILKIGALPKDRVKRVCTDTSKLHLWLGAMDEERTCRIVRR